MSEITYQLSQRLAEGLLYTAYRGIAHLPNGNQRDVVLKHIHPHLLQDGVLVSHLAGFADVYRGLSHPGLAPVWAFGKVGSDIFLVREYMPGISLQHLFTLVQRNEAALSPAMAIYLTQEIADAISSIHRYRVPGDQPIYLFHGGLAPENIILTRIGSVVVTDAGLDVIFWRNSDIAWRLCQRKQPYQPPEYATGERPMRRGDGFGVASLLYQMVMGTTLQEAARRAGSPFVAPSSQHSRITPQFDQFVYACLHPDIDHRLVQMKDIQQMLRQPGLLRQETMQRREAMAYLEVLVSESQQPTPLTSGELLIKGNFSIESLLPPRDDIPPPEERYRPPVYDSTESFHPNASTSDGGRSTPIELSIGAGEPLHESSGMGGETAASPPPVSAPIPLSTEDFATASQYDQSEALSDPPLHGEPSTDRTEVLELSEITPTTSPDDDEIEELEPIHESEEDDDEGVLASPLSGENNKEKPFASAEGLASPLANDHKYDDDDDDDEVGEETSLEPSLLASLPPPPMVFDNEQQRRGVEASLRSAKLQPAVLKPSKERAITPATGVVAATGGQRAKSTSPDEVLSEDDIESIESIEPIEAIAEEPPKSSTKADQILANILDSQLDSSMILGQGLAEVFDELTPLPSASQEESIDSGQVLGPQSESTTPSALATAGLGIVIDEDDEVDQEGETAQRPRADLILEHAETNASSLFDHLGAGAPDISLLTPLDEHEDDEQENTASEARSTPVVPVAAPIGKQEEEYTGELLQLSEDDAVGLEEFPASAEQTPAEELPAASDAALMALRTDELPAHTERSFYPATDDYAAASLSSMGGGAQVVSTPETVALPLEQASQFVSGQAGNGFGSQASLQGTAAPAFSSIGVDPEQLPPPGMPETVALSIDKVEPPPVDPHTFALKSHPPTPLAPGQERFGKFVLLNRVALGGMAEVFRAKFEGPGGFQKVVAVKRILPEYSQDVNFTQMFMDEARIAGSLRHPNIVQIQELGAIDGVFFISMEYIDGIDLARVIKIRRALQLTVPIELILDIGIAVCRALDYAHNECDPDGRPLQMIHRDVTPHNILISKKGECKLTDFGIAKASQNVAETAVGELKGKISYMSPEQAEGVSLDARSDIFQVGIVLYEMLTLRKMFEGNSDQSILNKIQNAEFAPPRRVLSGVPKHIEQVVMKALATDKEDRYQSSAELQKALSQCRAQFKVKEPVDVSEFAHEIIIQRDELLAQHAAARRQQVQQHAFNKLEQPDPLAGVSSHKRADSPPAPSAASASSDEAQASSSGSWRAFAFVLVLMLLVGAIVGGLWLTRTEPPQVVFLSVHTNPAGANVLLDEKIIGQTPMFELQLPHDTKLHTLRLVRPGFKEFSLSFHYTQPNETKRVQVVFQPLPQPRPRPVFRSLLPQELQPLPTPGRQKKMQKK